MDGHLASFKAANTALVCQLRIIDVAIQNDKSQNIPSVALEYLKHETQDELRRNIDENIEKLTILKQLLQPNRDLRSSNPVQDTGEPATLDLFSASGSSDFGSFSSTSCLYHAMLLENQDINHQTDIRAPLPLKTKESPEGLFLDASDSEVTTATCNACLPIDFKSNATCKRLVRMSTGENVEVSTRNGKRQNSDTTKGRQKILKCITNHIIRHAICH